MARQQLPPQIQKITLKSGATRYEVIAEAGKDAAGKRRQTRKRYRTEKEARTALSGIGTEVARGTYVAPTKLTVEQACSDWLAGKRVRATTMSNYTQALMPLRDRHGELPVQRLTKRHLDDLVTELAAGTFPRANERKRKAWSGGTLNYMLDRIEAVLSSLSDQGLLARNVATLVDRLPVPKKKMTTYAPEEVRSLLAAADQDRNGHAWHLALSGLRRGEIGGLRWADISFDAGTITIANNRVAANGKAIENDPKSEESERTLPMTAALRTVLLKARKLQRAERLAAGSGYGAGTHVVCNELGSSYHPDTLTDYWDKITRRAGVRRIRLHDARHTCGTTMHMQNVPIVVIAAWLGHADPSFTLRRYVHAQEDALVLAASSLDRVVTNRDISELGDKPRKKPRRGKSAG